MKIYNKIEGRVKKLIEKSHMFFVASAPTHGKFVNLSPKGLDATLKITGENQLMFIDVHGSGCETLSHIRENGRVCLMWCAYEGDPLIARVHGMGRAVLQGSDEFKKLVNTHFNDTGPLKPEQARSIIIIDAFQVMDSCGFAVPFMEYKSQRTRMPEALEKILLGIDMNQDTIAKWKVRGWSLDGLPAAGIAADGRQGTFWRPAKPLTTVQNWLVSNYQGLLIGTALGALLYHQKSKMA
eukprot:TRINITY_DN12214_c0_g1_i1.p1 TRINITY_DN12214_c0_g1~~TRINITY_DN12214_c0_g1_i1.p1  ORF type:complete len:239 (+),score=45.76 TRINITY_DN12214_c0_g1_i1:70-786(+)